MDYFDWYAAYLHRTCPVADAHRDLVTEVYRRRLSGEKGVLNKYYKNEFLKSGVNLVFASLFPGVDELEACREEGRFYKGAVLRKSMEMLSAFYEDLEETGGRVQLITDRESLCRVILKRGFSRQYRVGMVLYLEGLDMLEGEPELLYCFYRMGVRGAALTWNRRKEPVNAFAEGALVDAGRQVKEPAVKAFTDATDLMKEEGDRDTTEEGRQAITDRGVQALFLMEKLGMFVDSSHLSRQAAWLLPFFTKKPYAATHSNAAALREHPRNLTDDEIGEIVKRGGVIGVNGYREMNRRLEKDDEKEKHSVCGTKGGTGKEGRQDGRKPEAALLCDQIIYLLHTAGEDHVGFGLDLGEGNLFDGYERLPEVTAELLRRGCSVEVVKKVLGRNWIRFLAEILK